MHKIVLFIEPSDDAFIRTTKIGHLFMNRFGVDEDAAFEIINVFELGKTSRKMSYPNDSEYANFENERKEKGVGFVSKVYFL